MNTIEQIKTELKKHNYDLQIPTTCKRLKSYYHKDLHDVFIYEVIDTELDGVCNDIYIHDDIIYGTYDDLAVRTVKGLIEDLLEGRKEIQYYQDIDRKVEEYKKELLKNNPHNIIPIK